MRGSGPSLSYGLQAEIINGTIKEEDLTDAYDYFDPREDTPRKAYV